MATISVFLLFLLAGVAVGFPMPRSTSNDEALPRMRRRVGDLNITSTPQEYMRKLFDEYAYEDGRPKHAGSKPTDAWCFPDKGELSCILLETVIALLKFTAIATIAAATALNIVHYSLSTV